MNNKLFFGAHISREKTIVDTLKEIQNAKGNSLQIFVGNPRSARLSDKSYQDYMKEAPVVKSYLKEHNMNLYIHSSYTINFATPYNNPKDAYWIEAILKELKIGHEMGVNGVVFHVGKYTTAGSVEKGLDNMKKGISYVLSKIEHTGRPYLILETSAGQGTELLTDIEDFAGFYKSFTKEERKQLKICIDSAHVWAAGVSLSNAKETREFLDKTKSLCGKNAIDIIQLNNHAKDCGCNVDRHAELFAKDAKIPLESIAEFNLWASENDVTIILETPNDSYKTEIPWIASLVGNK